MIDPTTLQSMKPSTSSVMSAAIGVPAGIVVVYVLNQFLPEPLPTEVAAAVGSIVSILAGYFFMGGRSEDTF